MYHFLNSLDAHTLARGLEHEKAPLEKSPTYYNYPGQTDYLYEGSSLMPSVVARKLDNGATQYQLNAFARELSTDSDGNRRFEPVGFLYIKNVRQVEQRVRELART